MKDNPLFAGLAGERSLHGLLVEGAGLRRPDWFGRQLPPARTTLRDAPMQKVLRTAFQAEGQLCSAGGGLFFHAQPQLVPIRDKNINHPEQLGGDWRIGKLYFPPPRDRETFFF